MSRSTITINLDSITPLITCRLCGDQLTDTCVITACMHRFCRPCLDGWIRTTREHPVCPQCRVPLRHYKQDPHFDRLIYAIFNSNTIAPSSQQQPLPSPLALPVQHTTETIHDTAAAAVVVQNNTTHTHATIPDTTTYGDNTNIQPNTKQRPHSATDEITQTGKYEPMKKKARIDDGGGDDDMNNNNTTTTNNDKKDTSAKKKENTDQQKQTTNDKKKKKATTTTATPTITTASPTPTTSHNNTTTITTNKQPHINTTASTALLTDIIDDDTDYDILSEEEAEAKKLALDLAKKYPLSRELGLKSRVPGTVIIHIVEPRRTVDPFSPSIIATMTSTTTGGGGGGGGGSSSRSKSKSPSQSSQQQPPAMHAMINSVGNRFRTLYCPATATIGHVKSVLLQGIKQKYERSVAQHAAKTNKSKKKKNTNTKDSTTTTTTTTASPDAKNAIESSPLSNVINTRLNESHIDVSIVSEVMASVDFTILCEQGSVMALKDSLNVRRLMYTMADCTDDMVLTYSVKKSVGGA